MTWMKYHIKWQQNEKGDPSFSLKWNNQVQTIVNIFRESFYDILLHSIVDFIPQSSLHDFR